MTVELNAYLRRFQSSGRNRDPRFWKNLFAQTYRMHRM